MRLKSAYFALSAMLFVGVLLTLEPRAYAYVDPGSSLLVFQSISAVVTGALFYFRRRVKALFGRSSVGSNNTPGK